MGEFIIKMPDVGEGVAEAELVEWHVKTGDPVREDMVIAAVMTDKATVEIPSPVNGTVIWLAGEVGDRIAVKAPLVRIETAGDVGEISQTPIAEVRDTFLHYWQGRRRIYMANRIEKTLSPDWDDLTPPKEWAKMDYWKIRAYNYYYGITHAFSRGGEV